MRRQTTGAFTKNIPGGYQLIDVADATFFPGGASNVNIAPAAGTLRSIGATCITVPNLNGPVANQKWTIQSVSVRSQLTMVDLSSEISVGVSNSAIFGKLGKIIAGLIVDNAGVAVVQQGGFVQTSNGLINFPPDLTLTTTLFDPDVNELPPDDAGVGFSQNMPFLTVSCVLIPATPIELTAGMLAPSIGIWILPSLIGNAGPVTLIGHSPPGSWQRGIAVCNSQYAVNYDDGLPGR